MEVNKQLGFLKQQTENIDLEILLLLKRRFQTQKRIFDAQYKSNLEPTTDENDLDTMDMVMKRAREMEISESFIHDLYSKILDHTQELKTQFIVSKEKK
ncbi:MAG: chorismate mutase [Nanoarchaeota archaeon]|nr:chorismate mutase [Nanoarchaeota archaeon]